MTACAATHQLNNHLAGEDAAQYLADHRESLDKEYRALILGGHTIKINCASYSFEDLRPALSVEADKTLDHHLMMLLKGAGDAGKFLAEFLEVELDKVINEMIDAKIEEGVL